MKQTPLSIISITLSSLFIAHLMISTHIALKQILANCLPQKKRSIPLSLAQGSILSKPIHSPIPFPSFPQSAMDGYALRKSELDELHTLPIQDIVPAGDTRPLVLKQGMAIRIFTGAPVPEGADIVIMQEWIQREGDSISLSADAQEVKEGMNIRTMGSQTMKGETIMQQGDALTPAAISFLCGLGITEVEVFQKPTIAILTTGKELVSAGEVLQHGQIYESNSAGLKSALGQMQLTIVSCDRCDDDFISTKHKIGELLSLCDVLLITGGVSVGDYDFVTPALNDLGIETIFHKVKQKPGKPFYFGKKENQLIFGLPGNPASVMTCFYIYVYPALRALYGAPFPTLTTVPSTIIHIGNNETEYPKRKGLTHFLKAIYREGKTTLLPHQESYKMNSFAIANALAVLDENNEGVRVGDDVALFLLPS